MTFIIYTIILDFFTMFLVVAAGNNCNYLFLLYPVNLLICIIYHLHDNEPASVFLR